MEGEVEEEEEGIGAGVGAVVAAGTGGENMIDHCKLHPLHIIYEVSQKSNLQNAAGAHKY